VGARGCDSPGLPGEARFEPKSYGFRPGRGCADAIASLFTTLKGRSKRVWIVDADLSAAFDRIDHTRLLDALGSFPARGMIAGWLKAGVIEDGIFTPTEEGTPQGGVISPLMMNVALHGLEEAAGVRYQTSGRHAGDTRPGSPIVVRYADDLVVCAHSREQAEQAKARLAGWLAPRGLVFNEDKTKIVLVSANVGGGGWCSPSCGAVGEMEVGWPSGASLRGAASNRRALRPLTAVRGERSRKSHD